MLEIIHQVNHIMLGAQGNVKPSDFGMADTFIHKGMEVS
jgi:hypothetical protein